MRILGISAFHRDAAAALVVDGKAVAAAQEERFTRRRLDAAFPKRSIRACLDLAGLQARDLDRVVFYEKPLRKFERILACQLRSFPRSASSFAGSMFLWLGDRLWLKNRIANELGIDSGKVAFCEHQKSHAALAFFQAQIEKAAVLCADDAGEWATTSLFVGRGQSLEGLAEVHFPHSLGLVASAVTQFLGFEPGAEEGRVWDLAEYGEPRFAKEFAGLLAPEEGGAFRIQERAFRYVHDTEVLWGEELEQLLGPARRPGGHLRMGSDDNRDADVAASLQQALGDRVIELARELHRRTDLPDLCFAGELATNRAINARVLEEGPFERLHVPAAPADGGAALGAALWLHAFETGERPGGFGADLGELPIGDALEGAQHLNGDGSPSFLAKRLLDGGRMAWMHGPMELAPHTLGARGILVDPRQKDAASQLLACVQESEPWLACRYVVPAELLHKYFEHPAGSDSLLPYGFVQARPSTAFPSEFRAAIGPRGNAWIQSVDKEKQAELHELLHSFGSGSGAPLLLMADFRLRGAPLPRTENEAHDIFLRSGLDGLVVGNRYYER